MALIAYRTPPEANKNVIQAKRNVEDRRDKSVVHLVGHVGLVERDKSNSPQERIGPKLQK